MGIILLISLFSVRILLRELNVEDYGLYNAIGGVVTSLAFLSTILSSASQRFFSYDIGKNDIVSLNKNLSVILFIYILIAVILIIVGETFGLWFVINKMNYPEVQSNNIIWVFHFSLFTFIITLLATPFLSLIVSHEDMKIFAIISMVDAILKLGAAVSLSLFTNRIVIYPLILFVISIATALAYYFSVRINYKYIIVKIRFNSSLFKSIIGFTSWSSFGAIAGVGLHQGINIILNIFTGPIANAAYTIANQVYNAISTFGSSFFMAIRPGMIKAYAQSEENRLKSMYFISSKILFLLLFIVIVPILCETDFILKCWLGEVSEYTISFTRILSICALIMGLGLPITTIIQATGKIKFYHLVVDGFLCLGIIIFYFSLKVGYSGVLSLWIIAFVCSICHILRLIFLKHIIGISIYEYFYRCILPMLIISIITFISMHYIGIFNFRNQLFHFVIVTLSSIIVNLLLAFIFLMNKTEKSMLKRLLKREK